MWVLLLILSDPDSPRSSTYTLAKSRPLCCRESVSMSNQAETLAAAAAAAVGGAQ